MFRDWSITHLKISDSLRDFLNSKCSKLNEPIKTDKYEIIAWKSRNLGINGHGLIVDVLLVRYYFSVNGLEQYPMPYILIEVVKKSGLNRMKKKARVYLEKYPNIAQLEFFVLEYQSHTWYKFHRDGTETKTSYSILLDENLDDGIDWNEIDKYNIII